MEDNLCNGNLCVVILDLTPSIQLVKKGEGILTHCLDALMAFCNAHLGMNAGNKLAFIASHTLKSCFLYPLPQDNEQIIAEGQYERFLKLNQTIRTQTKDLVLNETHQTLNSESLLAGALNMALCYIQRINREAEKIGQKQNSSKILVVTSYGDALSQYLNFMNAFFCAQKQSTIIDACVLTKDCGLLKQGAEITGGIYMKIDNYSALLQYLLWIFLPDPITRTSMILPPSAHADFKTVCFCHGNSIETGFVCSVCLSVFCRFSPICSTCQATFKFNAILPSLKAKKKKKSNFQ